MVGAGWWSAEATADVLHIETALAHNDWSEYHQ